MVVSISPCAVEGMTIGLGQHWGKEGMPPSHACIKDANSDLRCCIHIQTAQKVTNPLRLLSVFQIKPVGRCLLGFSIFRYTVGMRGKQFELGTICLDNQYAPLWKSYGTILNRNLQPSAKISENILGFIAFAVEPNLNKIRILSRNCSAFVRPEGFYQ